MSQKDALAGSRIDRKKEETRRKIVSAALDLFRLQGFDATTMEQIAEEADIAKGTLYNYFPVKEAILSEYIQRESIERNSERIQRLRDLPDTRSRMIAGLKELMEGVRARKDIFEKYFVYRVQNMISLRRSADGEQGLHLLESEVIRLGQESGELRSDIPFDILEALFEFVFIEVAQRFYKNPGTFDADETIGQCVDLFINGAKRP